MEMVRRHVAECPNAVTTYMLCPNGIQKMMYPSQHEELSTRSALPKLVKEGEDPFGTFIEGIKTRGMEAFVTFRMNEVHNADNPKDPDLCTLWREHPEYRVARGENPSDWMSQCLDYSLEPVREHSLALITELIEKYQPDGIELDWMRFPRHLSGTGEEVWERRQFLTDVVAAVRAKANELTVKMYKPMLVAVRVPTSLEGCHALGADIVEWNRQKLIDFITASPFLASDFTMPLKEMREALKERPIPIYAGIEFGYGGDSHSEESIQAAAMSLYDCSADGIYLFNFPCWRETKPHPFWSWIPPLRDPNLLKGRNLLFPLIDNHHRIPNIDLPTQLPLEIPAGAVKEIPLHLPKLALAKNNPMEQATLTIDPKETLSVTLNGNTVGLDGDVPLEALHAGDNTLAVTNTGTQSISVKAASLALSYPLAVPMRDTTNHAKFYVSPDGSDDNPGTKELPVKTIQKARDMLRDQTVDKTKDFTVVLRGGVYRLDAPLTFGPRDSGKKGGRVIYAAAPEETPVISGGVLIAGWEQESNGRWKASVPLKDFRQLYVNGKRAQRARGICPENVERYGDQKSIDADAGFLFPDGAMADWKNPGAMELGFYNSWSHMICRVERITRDLQGRAVVKMLQPWFTLTSNKEGVQAKLPEYMENALELLDEPGEWYYDRQDKILYYLPRDSEDMTKAEVAAPQLETLMRVEGRAGQTVRNIVFHGITFADATWTRPNRIGHPDVQANFCFNNTNIFTRDGSLVNVHNEYIKSPANVVLRQAEGCRFEGCTFTRLGGAGLDIERGSKNNFVNVCEFFDISGSAIQVGDVLAVDHHPKTPGQITRNNRIANNRIHDIGMEYQDSIGVFGGYVDGTIIAHNEIFQLPYSGVSVGWGWGEEDAGGGAYENIPYRYVSPTPSGANQIVANHIHHVMLRRNDGGGIYMLGNQPATVIRDNYIHDNGPDGPGGIYLDEGSGFIEVTNNSVYSVPTAMNYNNRAQDRITTCFEHDNFFDIMPNQPEFSQAVADHAGLESAYRK
ncbi:MAG TPA: right-handed parallel beta-helix repeat-containing protein [Candidatus Hydrogenedentes bacterium]|nr:right-handed parallel beta-helix repeat-containing protein [Candidatus Hydrogenedentota bacterium]